MAERIARVRTRCLTFFSEQKHGINDFTIVQRFLKKPDDRTYCTNQRTFDFVDLLIRSVPADTIVLGRRHALLIRITPEVCRHGEIFFGKAWSDAHETGIISALRDYQGGILQVSMRYILANPSGPKTDLVFTGMH